MYDVKSEIDMVQYLIDFMKPSVKTAEKTIEELLLEMTKRILYLQVITHQVSKICKRLKDNLSPKEEAKIILDTFKITLESYCIGYLDSSVNTYNVKGFEENQKMAHELFSNQWENVSCFLMPNDTVK